MKKLFSIIVVILTALVLVGCNDDNYENARPSNVFRWDLYLQNEEILKRLDELETTLYNLQQYGDYVATVHEFDYQINDYEFFVVIIISRENNGNYWTYEVQEYNDDSYTAYVNSDKLFSIGEYAIGIEIENNSVVLIDLS